MKKIISIFLTIAVCVSVLSFTVIAKGTIVGQGELYTIERRDHSVYNNEHSAGYSLWYDLLQFNESFPNRENANGVLMQDFNNWYSDVPSLTSPDFLEIVMKEKYGPYRSTINTEISYEDQRIISIFHTKDWWQGGVSSLDYNAHVFSKVTGKELTLEELIGGGSERLESVRNVVWNYVTNNPTVGWSHEAVEGIGSYELSDFKFYVNTDGNVALLFNTYELTTGADGAIRIPLPISADHIFKSDYVASGSCGDNLTWTLDTSGTLTVSGHGKMWDYKRDDCADLRGLPDWAGGGETLAPWAIYHDEIKKLVVENGVTSIGDNAFTGSYSGGFLKNLATVVIADSVTEIGDNAFLYTYVSSLRLPSGLKSIGEAAFCGLRISEVSLPPSLENVGDEAFAWTNIKEVMIPKSVKSIGKRAFGYNYSADGAPTPSNGFAIYGYPGSEAERYYREMLEEYTVLPQKYPYFSEFYSDNFPSDGTVYFYGISSLTDVDYLAFSEFSYNNMHEDEREKTVKEIIVGWNLWDSEWKATGIKYSELYAGIAEWKLLDFKSTSAGTGFYGMAFENNGDILITFRGTESIFSNDAITDLLAIVGTDLPQLSHAFAFYNEVVAAHPGAMISLTGHSLGGALAEIVSACTTCRAVTFNSAPFLDVAYFYHMKDMSIRFAGTDQWNFIDHVNANCPVGTMHMDNKPYYLHNGVGNSGVDLADGSDKLVPAHMLQNLIEKNDDGTLSLTSCKDLICDISPYWAVSIINNVRLGTSSDDTIHNEGMTTAAMYGGDGADKLYGSFITDYLSGGAGDDVLDGGYGNDTYIYNKGDGFDTIYDGSGFDTLCLVGFGDADTFSAEEDANFSVLKCNGVPILRVYNKRGFMSVDSWKVDIADYDFWDESLDINRYMKVVNYIYHYEISCPVDLEIIDDATGQNVLHIDGQAQATYYTDYGNFYVYENADGDFVKIADIIEGYSVRILGTGTGTMNVTAIKTDSIELSESYSAYEIPVTETTIAVFSHGEDGTSELLVDADGDGSFENRIPLLLDENEIKGVSEDAAGEFSPSGTEKNNETDEGNGEKPIKLSVILTIGIVAAVAIVAVAVVLVIKRRRRI